MKNKFLIHLTVLTLVFSIVLAGCSSNDDTESSLRENDSSTLDGKITDTNVPMRDIIKLSDKIATGITRNADTVGWITIPNMEVDEAVLQRNDPTATHRANNEYYLRIDEDKKWDLFSCYWTDPDSVMGTRNELSKNTIIYGHADYKDDGNGPRFSQLFKYNDIDFLKENPYIYFSTEEEDMVWQVFSVFYTHIDFDYIMANPSDAKFDEILSGAKARNEYIMDVPVSNKDNILTLSTCTGLYNPGDMYSFRYVVMAKLLPTTQVPQGAIEIAENPSPQASF